VIGDRQAARKKQGYGKYYGNGHLPSDGALVKGSPVCTRGESEGFEWVTTRDQAE
jgi:hypothetical protein